MLWEIFAVWPWPSSLSFWFFGHFKYEREDGQTLNNIKKKPFFFNAVRHSPLSSAVVRALATLSFVSHDFQMILVFWW